jgi:signal transduction histidine kinase
LAANTPSVIGQLLALVAHDLRNPLSALHSNVGFLEASLPERDSEVGEALFDIAASCGSLAHIIDNLELLGMDAARGHPVLERGPVQLWEATVEVLDRMRPIAQSYGVRTEFEAERTSSPRVLAHREMLSRALANLLFNSVQNGGARTAVTLSFATAGRFGIVRIADGGVPVPEPLRDVAFTAEGQLTYKGDPAGRYGRGLGLYAARIAAELAGVQVVSSANSGGHNVFELRAELA